MRRSTRPWPKQPIPRLRHVLRRGGGQRGLAQARCAGDGSVPLGSHLDLPPPSPVRLDCWGGAPRPLYGAPAARSRRRHHHGPHLAGRTDPGAERGGPVAHRQRRGSARSQRLCVTARQLGGHAARSLREPNRSKRSRPGDPARLLDPCPDRRDPALWRVAERYRGDRQPMVVVAGERYGTGSSRTGPPRASACSASAPFSLRASSASTGRT